MTKKQAISLANELAGRFVGTPFGVVRLTYDDGRKASFHVVRGELGEEEKLCIRLGGREAIFVKGVIANYKLVPKKQGK